MFDEVKSGVDGLRAWEILRRKPGVDFHLHFDFIRSLLDSLVLFKLNFWKKVRKKLQLKFFRKTENLQNLKQRLANLP